MVSYFDLTALPSEDTAPMEKTRLSSKGQLVLPKSIRESRGWSEGTEFVVELVADGVLLRPARPFPPTRLDDVIGSASYRGPAVSLRRMEQSIANKIRERRGRGRY